MSPSAVLRVALLLAVVVASPAAAQPSSAALLSAWQADWDEAAEGVESIRLAESLRRTIDGPRGVLDIETHGTVRVAPLLRPRRSVDRATVNGEAIDSEKLSGMERRLRHALGRAAMDLRRPAALPSRVLASAQPSGPVEPDRLGATPTWRMTAHRPTRRGPPERMTAWFSPSSTAPRLLRLDLERPLPDGGMLVRTTTYARHAGLDLPSTHAVRAEVVQRRRLRTYTLSIRADADYSRPSLETE